MPSIAVFFFIALPWLNPLSPGPSPAVVPWLITLSSFAVVLVLAGTVRLAEVSAKAWLVAALLSSLMGLLQYFGQSVLFSPWINLTNLGDAFANLRQRNQFATLTNIGLAALLWWVAPRPAAPGTATNAARTGWHWAASVAALVAAALLAVGNATSSSRTGLVQLGLLGLLALVWGGWRQPATRRVLVLALLAYGVAAFSLPLLLGLDVRASGILARLHDGGPACASRLTLWSNVLHLIAQKPALGWGWGGLSYAHFITLYPEPRFCDILDNAHNLPLHLAVELGLPAALVLCGGGLWLVWRARPWCEVDATRQLAWTVLALVLLHSLLEYPLWYGPFQVAFGLSVWFLWRRPPWVLFQFEKDRLLAPVLSGIIATILMVFAAYTAWDYQRVSQLYQTQANRLPFYRDNTLAKVGDSWLFPDQVRFAELTTTSLTPDNAVHQRQLALSLLYFSPEPRVIEKLIESNVMLERDTEAAFYLVRLRAAFPERHAIWVKEQQRLRP